MSTNNYGKTIAKSLKCHFYCFEEAIKSKYLTIKHQRLKIFVWVSSGSALPVITTHTLTLTLTLMICQFKLIIWNISTLKCLMSNWSLIYIVFFCLSTKSIILFKVTVCFIFHLLLTSRVTPVREWGGESANVPKLKVNKTLNHYLFWTFLPESFRFLFCCHIMIEASRSRKYVLCILICTSHTDHNISTVHRSIKETHFRLHIYDLRFSSGGGADVNVTAGYPAAECWFDDFGTNFSDAWDILQPSLW